MEGKEGIKGVRKGGEEMLAGRGMLLRISFFFFGGGSKDEYVHRANQVLTKSYVDFQLLAIPRDSRIDNAQGVLSRPNMNPKCKRSRSCRDSFYLHRRKAGGITLDINKCWKRPSIDSFVRRTRGDGKAKEENGGPFRGRRRERMSEARRPAMVLVGGEEKRVGFPLGDIAFRLGRRPINIFNSTLGISGSP